jgi:hypothetical protein
MDEGTQQLLALGIVVLAVGLELLRRYRKKRAGKVGCEGCDTPSGAKPNAAGESPVRFYKKR